MTTESEGLKILGIERHLKKSEEEITEKLSKIIYAIDKMIFSRRPIKVVAILYEKPKGNNDAHAAFFTSKDQSICPDHYMIKAYGIDKFMKKRLKDNTILLRGINDGTYKRYEDLPKLTLEQELVSIAAHEIRHRVQGYYRRLKMVSANILQEVESKYLKELIRYTKMALDDVKPPKGHYETEFDARVIEYMVSEVWYYGVTDYETISEIIRASVKDLEYLCYYDTLW